MTDITTKDLLEVARGLEQAGFKFERIQGDENYYVHRQVAGKTFLCHFNPLTSDADAFKVLEALVEKGWSISVTQDSPKMFCVEQVEPMKGRLIELSKNKDLRTAIVKSYLSLIGE